MTSGSDFEKNSPVEQTNSGQNTQTLTNSSKNKNHVKRIYKAWLFLFGHAICCLALSLTIVLKINGYNAIEKSSPRYSNGKLRLRVSDVTTLVSAGLVIIKYTVTCWSAVAVWRCAYILTQSTESGLSPQQLSFMTKYKMPPWLGHPFTKPNGIKNWMIAAILLLLLPQSFTAPLLSGAIDWSPSSVPVGTTIPVNSTVPTASFDPDWYQYTESKNYSIVRKSTFRAAAGLASLAWSDPSTISANGTSLTGNGCRHVVNDDGLSVNSTLIHFIVPCIQIHNISWEMSDDYITRTVSNGIFAPSSLVDDNPQQYRTPGQAVLFDPNQGWNDSQAGFTPPNPTLFSGTLRLGLLIADQYTDPDCTGLRPNSFGDVNAIPYYKLSWAEGVCYLVANVTLTAGVTTSALSSYLSSRIIEDQTPIEKVVFEPNSWVQESLWLLPDLMTMVAVTNSTQLPTWDNVDLYAENLIRRSYLAAWGSLHAAFELNGVVSMATPREARNQATVSYQRVFAWLGISFMMTFGGILLLLLSFGEEEPELTNEVVAAKNKEGKKDVKILVKDVTNMLFS